MKSTEEVSLRLSKEFVGRILDGLEVLAEQWEYTAEHVTFGFCTAEGDHHVRECSGPDEAREIAAAYREVIEEIGRQRG